MNPASQTFRLPASLATTNATLVSDGECRVFGVQGVNTSGAAIRLKLYESRTAPTAGVGTPRKVLYLPTGAAFAYDFSQGLVFNGLSFTFVTGSADSNTTAVGAGDVTDFNIDYSR